MNAQPTRANFDDLKRLRDEAARKGIGSRAFFTFCQTFYDQFPAIYETAQRMNEALRNPGDCPPKIRHKLAAKGWIETDDSLWEKEEADFETLRPLTWEDAILIEIASAENQYRQIVYDIEGELAQLRRELD